MFKKISRSKTNGIISAALLISISTFLSGILGLLRDRLLAGQFGAGPELDIYFASFRIPDLVQSFLVAGGISAVFLPIFSEEFKKSKEKAFLFTNNLLHCISIFLIISCFVLFLLAPLLVNFIVPGFDVLQKAKTVSVTRIMLLSPILFALSSIFSGILHYFNRFLVYGLAPIFYNIGIILGILFLVPVFGIYGLAIGVVLGAIVHLLIQIPSARNAGYVYQKILNFKNYRLKKVFELMGPSAFGILFIQLNLIVTTFLCSNLASGTITIFSFARNLQSIPIGLIAVPLATAIFPLLSKSLVLENKQKFQEVVSLGISQILFFMTPLSILVFILRAQIVRIVLGAGQWGWTETRLTAACLGIFSFSLLASSLVIFFRKIFYSLQETKKPTLVEGLIFLLNVGLSLLFLFLFSRAGYFSEVVARILKVQDIKEIGILSFPLAIAFSTWAQMFLFLPFLMKKTGFPRFLDIFVSVKNIVLLSLLMGVAVWLSARWLVLVFPLNSFWNVLFQAGISSIIGFFVYLGGAILLRLPELKYLWDSFVGRKNNLSTEKLENPL